jgi:hypothetical protein
MKPWGVGTAFASGRTDTTTAPPAPPRAAESPLACDAGWSSLVARRAHDPEGAARDSAVAAVVRKQVRAGNERHQRRAQGLRELPEEVLNAHITQPLGADVVAELEVRARENNTDSKLYKALHLAKEKPDDVDAILKTARKPAD